MNHYQANGCGADDLATVTRVPHFAKTTMTRLGGLR